MFTCFAATSSDIAFEQAPVTEIHIRSICGKIGTDWRDLGTVLRLDSALMDNIEADFSECRERARKVLQKGKQKKTEMEQQWELLSSDFDLTHGQ